MNKKDMLLVGLKIDLIGFKVSINIMYIFFQHQKQNTQEMVNIH